MTTASKHEELANSLTHGIGVVLSAAGLAVLVDLAATRGTGWHVVSFCVYGVSMVLLYAASTLYHSFRSPGVKHLFQIIDHASIYLLIAGTYTPFLLVNLRGAWGWSLFGVIWGVAVAGIVFQAFFIRRFKLVATLLYVLMGWMVVVAIKPLVATVEAGGIWLLLAGGLCYTLGVIFYLLHRMRFHHAIWHLMVLAGSACHYFAILLYVLPCGDG